MTDLIQQYRHMHHNPAMFVGKSLAVHIPAIWRMCTETKSKSILDYGCGKAAMWQSGDLAELLSVEVTLYDPAVSRYAQFPRHTFHGVVCTDVMEHVDESAVDETLETIFSMADRFAFLAICTREAKKLLPDGRNCHLTVKPEEWWESRIVKAKHQTGRHHLPSQTVFTE